MLIWAFPESAPGSKDRTNYAAGLFNLARNIGGSSGIAGITTLLARRAQFHQVRLVEHLTPHDAAYRSALSHTTELLHARGFSLPDAAARAPALIYGNVQRQASMLAFADAFWIMAVLFLAVVPLMSLKQRSAPGRGPVPMERGRSFPAAQIWAKQAPADALPRGVTPRGR